MRHDDKVAIVTGAANGIGKACALHLAKEGAKLVVADVDATAGEACVAEVNDDGGEAIFLQCDVAERLDIHNMLAATLENFGAIDILINNAGIMHGAPFLDLEENDFNRVINTNLKGAFFTGQTVARQMVAQLEDGRDPGSIINMSSVNAVVAIPDHVPYAVSKGGITMLTKSMAMALAPHGIRVNAIGPGSIATDMLENVKSDEAAMRKILSRTPLGRIGEPGEIAAIASFLASQEASYITGQTIYADGGRLGLNYTMPE